MTDSTDQTPPSPFDQIANWRSMSSVTPGRTFDVDLGDDEDDDTTALVEIYDDGCVLQLNNNGVKAVANLTPDQRRALAAVLLYGLI